VHENSAPGIDSREGLAALIESTRNAASGLPLVVGYRGELCATADAARELAEQIPGLRGIGGDLSVDGSIGARTAALREPYRDEISDGIAYFTAEQVAAHVRAVTEIGLQTGFHVIGDRGMPRRPRPCGVRCAASAIGSNTRRCSTTRHWRL